jgi:hypothetical protein
MDEAGLIPDEIETSLYRMIAGKGDEAFYCKLGNPFYRNHFMQSWHSPRYKQILIDYKQALAEGRYTEDFIEEARDKPMWEVYYECRFPEEDELDEKGFRRLISIEDIQKAFIPVLPVEEKNKEKKLGADIGRGGNYSAFVLRTNETMWLESKNQSADLMTQVSEIERILKENRRTILGKEKSLVKGTAIDDAGVGGGVTDRCKEKGIYVQGVRTGGEPKRKEKFANIRSEITWELRTWILKGGKLLASDHWLILYEIKYKVNSQGKMIIEPKEEMMQRAKQQLRKLGSSSPDVVDAGSLTFVADDKPSLEFID